MSQSQRQKALEVNLNSQIYGTFAEIGAGQEVARHFFQAGGAAGTIAKSISAYDMAMSDAIYGKEISGRYVCEARLKKMLETEFHILCERLNPIRQDTSTFFSFANTVVAKSFRGTGENHGWIGLTFQNKPKAKASTIVLHVRMHDAENIQQQEVLGLLGVNLIHAAFYSLAFNEKNEFNREKFILAIMDGITTARLSIDMIRVDGPAFVGVDSRLLSLELVKLKLCEAVIFDEKGQVLEPSDVLYKKNVLVLRGGFRPPTKLSMDMLKSGEESFKLKLTADEKENIITIPEISMSQLLDRGEIIPEDFLARVDLLRALGQKVLISNCDSISELSLFFSKYAKKSVAFVMATYNLEEFLNGASPYHLGVLFSGRTRLFIYPSVDDKTSELKTMKEANLKDELTFLFLYLYDNQLIHDVNSFDPLVVSIWSRKVLNMLEKNEEGWEEFVPKIVAKKIISDKLFQKN